MYEYLPGEAEKNYGNLGQDGHCAWILTFDGYIVYYFSSRLNAVCSLFRYNFANLLCTLF
jgi:hypothetical protein